MAEKVQAKYAMAQYIADHVGQLHKLGGASSSDSADGLTIAKQLLSTLLEQRMRSLEDARSFMTADTLTALGVPSSVATAFLAGTL